MNLGGISIALGLVALGLATLPYGLVIFAALVWIYMKS